MDLVGFILESVEEEGGESGDGVVGRVEEGADGFGASGAIVVAAAFLRAGGNGGHYGIHGRLSRAGIGNRSSTRLRQSGKDKRWGVPGKLDLKI